MTKTDLEIAREARKQPIQAVGEKLGIPSEHLLPFGHDKAKVSAEFIRSLEGRPDGKLVLVTAINPTPAGEGKTTTTVGLSDGLNALGKKSVVCIREPSLGPCFGMKGGAAGGGYAQVVPMEDINLHFTGDFHAITSAHNLLAAMIDNHIYWGNPLDIDPRRIAWRRVLDMNDRALRDIVTSLGGVANGYPRQTGFDITVASEIMAILCLATDLEDLRRRLGDIIVAYTRDRKPVYARDLKAEGAMTVLLQQAMQPNLVQTLENNPAFVHGGPFANIAHGCNSVVATRTALKLGDYVVTEAGFGADLGAEKFFDIKCRKAGLHPDVAVIVATVRALKMNGGVGKAELGAENVEAVRKGCANLGRHIANVRSFGVPVVVAINHFHTDTDAEIAAVQEYVSSHGAEAIVARHWAEGSKGTKELAERVIALAESGASQFDPLYPDDMPLMEKIETIAERIYRADEVLADTKIRNQLREWEAAGYGNLPICMAKTQYSFSTDP
ncbi:MAG TPA: formate--tetrahydrofolate ligase, partial [Paracoccaceae bacterium]|nr:formate--tetrahydrofolate ligase [Paracoccaceae bacterium]